LLELHRKTISLGLLPRHILLWTGLDLLLLLPPEQRDKNENHLSSKYLENARLKVTDVILNTYRRSEEVKDIPRGHKWKETGFISQCLDGVLAW
jgi:hypothetical protein